MAEQSKKNSSGNGMKIIVVVGILVIVALLAAILIVVLKNSKQDAPEEKRAVVVNTPDKAEDIAEEMINEEYVAPGYYEVVQTTDWHFSSGDAESSDAHVENVTTNTNDVYFDIVLSEDETQVIYESPVLPRGSKLENIKLDVDLEPGTYDCVMIYHLVDENQTPISELRVALTIYVEN